LNSNNKNKKILFVITFSPFARGGCAKNFLNLIKLTKPYFDQSQYKSIICSLDNLNQDLKAYRLNISNERILHGIKIDYFKRIFPGVKTIYQIMEFISNLFQIFKIMLKYNPNIVYAYGDKSLYLSSFWKFLFRYKLITDLRGEGVNERKQRGWNKKKLAILSKLDRLCRNKSDKVFIVSDAYKDVRKNSKYVVKYNYYDGDLFEYNEEKVTFKRNELGLSNKFIFIYTGGIHKYQMIEEMVFFFSEFNKIHIDSFFIIISEYDRNEFIKYFDKYSVSSTNYSIYPLKHKEVNDVQMIADIALLIREDIPVNHYAFPTKFAEYLASGVPVLTTPHLYSIAPMVSKNNLGELIETIKIGKNYDSLIDFIYNKYKNNFEIKRKCALFAQKNLMWQKKAKEIFQIIDKIQ